MCYHHLINSLQTLAWLEKDFLSSTEWPSWSRDYDDLIFKVGPLAKQSQRTHDLDPFGSIQKVYLPTSSSNFVVTNPPILYFLMHKPLPMSQNIHILSATFILGKVDNRTYHCMFHPLGAFPSCPVFQEHPWAKLWCFRSQSIYSFCHRNHL